MILDSFSCCIAGVETKQERMGEREGKKEVEEEEEEEGDWNSRQMMLAGQLKM